MNKRYIICYRTENGGKDVVERHTATKSSITRTARDIASFSRAMVVYEIVEEDSRGGKYKQVGNLFQGESRITWTWDLEIIRNVAKL